MYNNTKYMLYLDVILNKKTTEEEQPRFDNFT